MYKFLNEIISELKREAIHNIAQGVDFVSTSFWKKGLKFGDSLNLIVLANEIWKGYVGQSKKNHIKIKEEEYAFV